MSDAVTIQSVSKVFKLAKDKPKSAKERVIRAGRIKWERFQALDDVSFEVHQGETFAILGHNGSGKSTLLKCVAGTLRPTSGVITTRGRVAALLELGAGFHPDLTGRENVYLNGSILGFSKVQIDGIFDDVVAFAELEDFIDQQVKHYSSGMYARLGFAVAINVEPDLLLVDEVLSVGDEAFQRKCIDRIKKMQRDGRTILVVSHAADTVRQICDRAVVLDHGKLIAEGSPGTAIQAFREALAARGAEIPLAAQEAHEHVAANPDPVTGEQAAITVNTSAVPDTGLTVKIRDVVLDHGSERDHILPGEALRVRVVYSANGPIDDIASSLEIFDESGNRLLSTGSDVLDQPLENVQGEGTIDFVLEQVPLMDGTYPITVSLHTHDGGLVYDESEFHNHFSVLNPGRASGLVFFPTRVEHRPGVS